MGGDCTSLSDFFDGYAETSFMSPGATASDDIFSMLEVLEGVSDDFTSMAPLENGTFKEVEHVLVSQKLNSSCSLEEPVEAKMEKINSPKSKRQRVSMVEEGGVNSDGQPKVSHITVERNRRKQMNEHLTVLRSLMPYFYVKRGDQASIIGGVVDYITELQQILQSLEANKQRKVNYIDVLNPRTSTLSPRKPPISPRPPLPISPRTPQSVSPYRARLPQPPVANSSYMTPSSMANYTLPLLDPSPSSSSSTSDIDNDLVANAKSSIADVEVKFSGSNLLLKTVSPRLPGQAMKIVSVLEDLSLEILKTSINVVDETMVNSFTIKIGIECQLSAEDLVQHIQHTFC